MSNILYTISTDLTEESLHVTSLQLQSLNDVWICLVELGQNLIVVAICDVVFRIVKGIHQLQDVAKEKSTTR